MECEAFESAFSILSEAFSKMLYDKIALGGDTLFELVFGRDAQH